MYRAIAPAKLNLSLHIHGKRPDGYHLIESLVAFTQFGDEVTVEAASELSLVMQGEFAEQAGAPENNLVLRAARALAQRFNITHGARITLKKNIPVGAGLGGGSSDAACAMHLLARLWNIAPSLHDLQAIGLPLGADIPMCLHAPHTVIARGIGEEITPLPFTITGHVVLVYPHVHVATKQVYAALDNAHTQPLTQWQAASSASIWPMLQHTRNHLQRAAISVAPQIAEVLLAMETAPFSMDLIRMSGSGSCCIAITQEKSQAQGLASYLVSQHPHWWVMQTALGQ
jgi:4-diphosphocytidyl-2-C-methyl-D-erythritol kinase